ncbi:hypothetical protein L207DRAFT_131759 [Hyaloscypha variabilis F]|uniref:Uncharacterized protein n=1 Tax=Hyaloscypha variabilis (strain UAMH 11265 / GT02V1 / F) TaxID=1149755 RepID=A0A2J6R9C2_HYAVF|nr:hypothetical protein L207DRAFT_131759 [Hyaloscypha variabilis F]
MFPYHPHSRPRQGVGINIIHSARMPCEEAKLSQISLSCPQRRKSEKYCTPVRSRVAISPLLIIQVVSLSVFSPCMHAPIRMETEL